MSADNFEAFYQEMFAERWPQLKAACLSSGEYKISRFNLFSSDYRSFFLSAESAQQNPYQIIAQSNLLAPAGSDDVAAVAEGAVAEDARTLSKPNIARDQHGLLKNYIMDIASYWAALALGVRAGDKVLDMCAAPGGKTLILAEALAEEGELIANEVSAARRERLMKVIQQYVPRDIRERFFVTGKDGGKFALTHSQYFDRILVDAPCSGERHTLQSPSDLQQWTKNRSSQLAQRQYALLTAALLACKPGGKILYSTCALSELENDAVIERLIKKKSDKIPFAPVFDYLDSSWAQQMLTLGAERTRFGVRIWPDRAQGAGPIYFALLSLSDNLSD